MKLRDSAEKTPVKVAILPAPGDRAYWCRLSRGLQVVGCQFFCFAKEYCHINAKLIFLVSPVAVKVSLHFGLWKQHIGDTSVSWKDMWGKPQGFGVFSILETLKWFSDRNQNRAGWKQAWIGMWCLILKEHRACRLSSIHKGSTGPRILDLIVTLEIMSPLCYIWGNWGQVAYVIHPRLQSSSKTEPGLELELRLTPAQAT